MSKLPEAFEKKTVLDSNVELQLGESQAWADGYNTCLEQTGARELYEALRDLLMYHGDAMMVGPSINELNRIRVILNKYNK